jgi:hypothetical protein
VGGWGGGVVVVGGVGGERPPRPSPAACLPTPAALPQIHNSKAVLRPLHDSVGALAGRIGGARGVAAAFVGAPHA